MIKHRLCASKTGFANITTFLILLTLMEQPDCSGKRSLGKLAGKEICKMVKLKFEGMVIFKV